MNIQQNVSLKKYNSFGVDVNAKRFISVDSIEALQHILKQEQDVLVIGGGSNVLFTSEIEKLVIHLNLKGKQLVKQGKNTVEIKVQAGENWHKFVLFCIENNYGGLENLSLIPGNVGTCPIQNIGAYGVEVKDVITTVETIEVATGKTVVFSNQECAFGYRDSIFKNKVKGQYIITAVSFLLTQNKHQLNTSYGAIETELLSKGIKNPTLKEVSDAVISIRKSKLPDPKKIGNGGSFFKNPIISINHFEALQTTYPQIPHYFVSQENVKIPAAWLIEQTGFKGKRHGHCGVHKKQALVLVNYGSASGKAIYELAQKIQRSVNKTFNIDLDIEVNIL